MHSWSGLLVPLLCKLDFVNLPKSFPLAIEVTLEDNCQRKDCTSFYIIFMALESQSAICKYKGPNEENFHQVHGCVTLLPSLSFCHYAFLIIFPRCILQWLNKPLNAGFTRKAKLAISISRCKLDSLVSLTFPSRILFLTLRRKPLYL